MTESEISHITITNSDSDISAIELSDSDSDEGMEMDSVPLLNNNTHVNNSLTSADKRSLRKRQSNVLCSDTTTDTGEQYHPLVKTPRLDYTPPKSELSDGLEDVQINDEITTERGSKRKTRRGKGGTSKTATNREQQELSTGRVKRTSDCNNDSVTLDCQILVRFPDGRRCVKSFHSQSPIQV